MTARKTPILLRRSPLTGEVMALYRYTRKTIRGRVVLDAGMDGKQDVTSDFETLLLEALVGPDSSDIAAILDGAAKGMKLNADERKQVRAFRERLIAMIERHNARLVEIPVVIP